MKRSTERLRNVWLNQARNKQGEDALFAALWLTCVVQAQTSHHSIAERFEKVVKAA